jgi:hypothetical protein
MTLVRHWIPSPNYSSRGGSGVRLVIVHTAEGARTYQELGNYFAGSGAGVSSHVGIDDQAGHCGEYVKPPNKAWTAGDANPYAIQAELCGFAAWGPSEWERHPNMLDNTARWIAEECKRYGLPIQKLSAGQTASGRGVCGHVDVSGPGGHWDPGNSFPWDKVIAAAKSGGHVYGPPAPPPWEPRGGIPIAALAAGMEDPTMPPDYVIHDKDGDYYAVFGSGIVRKCFNVERDGWDVPTLQAEMNDTVRSRFNAYDQAMQGLIKERK